MTVVHVDLEAKPVKSVAFQGGNDVLYHFAKHSHRCLSNVRQTAQPAELPEQGHMVQA